MRELLFRGKRVDNGEWVYGSLLKQAGEYISKDEVTPDECWICGMRGEKALIVSETIGQYTGLKDLHSTRIFEADIVKVYDVYCNETVVGVVEFCDGSFRIYDKDFTSYDRWMYYEVEVIGNIHDNPELMGGNTHG